MPSREFRTLQAAPGEAPGNVTVSAVNSTALRVSWIVSTSVYEPSRGKTNNVVSDRVQHKPTCTVTEKS